MKLHPRGEVRIVQGAIEGAPVRVYIHVQGSRSTDVFSGLSRPSFSKDSIFVCVYISNKHLRQIIEEQAACEFSALKIKIIMRNL